MTDEERNLWMEELARFQKDDTQPAFLTRWYALQAEHRMQDPDVRFAESDADYTRRQIVGPSKEAGVVLAPAEVADLDCIEYEPAPTSDTWGSCLGMGHYLCQDCALYAKSPEPA